MCYFLPLTQNHFLAAKYYGQPSTPLLHCPTPHPILSSPRQLPRLCSLSPHSLASSSSSLISSPSSSPSSSSSFLSSSVPSLSSFLPRLLCLLHLLHHSCSHDGDKRVASTLPGGAWNRAGGQRAEGPQRREKGTTALSWALSTVTKAAFSVRPTACGSAWLL